MLAPAFAKARAVSMPIPEGATGHDRVLACEIDALDDVFGRRAETKWSFDALYH